MKTYLEISNTGNVALMALDGTLDEGCLRAWDELTKINAKHNNDLGFMSYVSNLRMYATLLADYTLVKTALLKLLFVIDNELITWLGKKGYAIVLPEKGMELTSGAAAYAESVNRALYQSGAITTQLIMRRNKIMARIDEKMERVQVGIEEIIANLSFQLGFEVDDNITLARFNEYKKIIKAKNEAAKKAKK